MYGDEDPDADSNLIDDEAVEEEVVTKPTRKRASKKKASTTEEAPKKVVQPKPRPRGHPRKFEVEVCISPSTVPAREYTYHNVSITNICQIILWVKRQAHDRLA